MLTIDLATRDGNLRALMSTARDVAKRLGLDERPIIEDMQSGTYAHSLDVFERYFSIVEFRNRPVPRSNEDEQ